MTQLAIPPPPSLLFVDVETTGIRPDKDYIVDIALIKTDLFGTRLGLEYDGRLLPPKDAELDLTAIGINGYTREKWRLDAVDPDVVEEMLLEMGDGNTTLAGWNIGFDKAFCENFLLRRGKKPSWTYRTLDVHSLAFPLFLHPDWLGSHSLNSVAAHYHIPRLNVHSAKEDTEITLDIFRRLTSNMKSKKLKK